MRLALIPGHGWRVRRGKTIYDPGAVAGGHTEADLVRRLAKAIKAEANQAGRWCEIFDGTSKVPTTYAQRTAAIPDPQIPTLILHLHLNASANRATYGLALYDERSSGGYASAQRLSAQLASTEAPWRADFRPTRASAENVWSNAYNCIESAFELPAKTHAVLLEFGFLTDPALVPWLLGNGETWIGQKIAAI